MVLAEAKVATNVMVLAEARSWITRRSYTSTSSPLILCAAVMELKQRLTSNQSPWPNHSRTAGIVFDEMPLAWGYRSATSSNLTGHDGLKKYFALGQLRNQQS